MSLTAIWFSRHPATVTQIDEIRTMGFELDSDPKWAELASRQLMTEEDVSAVATELEKFSAETGPREARAIFGVFAAPIQAACNKAELEDDSRALTPCYSAWNVMRTQEGGKPTFEHLRFCRTGQI